MAGIAGLRARRDARDGSNWPPCGFAVTKCLVQLLRKIEPLRRPPTEPVEEVETARLKILKRRVPLVEAELDAICVKLKGIESIFGGVFGGAGTAEEMDAVIWICDRQLRVSIACQPVLLVIVAEENEMNSGLETVFDEGVVVLHQRVVVDVQRMVMQNRDPHAIRIPDIESCAIEGRGGSLI